MRHSLGESGCCEVNSPLPIGGAWSTKDADRGVGNPGRLLP